MMGDQAVQLFLQLLLVLAEDHLPAPLPVVKKGVLNAVALAPDVGLVYLQCLIRAKT